MKRQRRPPHLTAEQTAEFLKLQEKWDAKLRADGFKDEESGSDLNEFSASSFKGGANPEKDGITFVPLEPEDDDQPHTSFADAPEAQYWRLFADAAHKLRKSYPRRALILAVAEAGMLRDSLLRRHHMSYDAALGTIERFCAKFGISRPRFRASPTKREKEPEALPAPVRTYSRAEMKLLGATPPKQIPDKTIDEKWKKAHPPVVRKRKKAAA